MLAALAQATSRLRMGTMVTGIHYRHPAVLANMIATLDIISRSRAAPSTWPRPPAGTPCGPSPRSVRQMTTSQPPAAVSSSRHS
jgi:hypothetical protein